MNNRGIIGIILFFSILLIILIAGFSFVMITGVLDITSDAITPIMEDIGVVGDTNVSEISEYTFGVTDSIIQSLPWLVGFCYIAALIFSILFVVYYGQNPNPIFIGFYMILIILLIFGSIIMSNAYEEIYTGSDELATRLQDNVLMSHMILYSPFILTLIALITGIYLFAKPSEATGGFGV